MKKLPWMKRAHRGPEWTKLEGVPSVVKNLWVDLSKGHLKCISPKANQHSDENKSEMV